MPTSGCWGPSFLVQALDRLGIRLLRGGEVAGQLVDRRDVREGPGHGLRVVAQRPAPGSEHLLEERVPSCRTSPCRA